MRLLTLVAVVALCANYVARGSTINGDQGPVGSDPLLVVGSGWGNFSWNNAPGTFDNEGAFTFTVPAGLTEKLFVTDAFVDGDQFTVFNFGGPLFTTSVPANDGLIINNFDAAFASSSFSHGTDLLGPGNYSITMKTIAIANGYPGGGGGIQLQLQSVPEPSTAVLCVLGAAGLYMVSRRRRAAKAR